MKPKRKQSRSEMVLSDRELYGEILYRSKLTPQERRICDMRYLEGLSFTEIATALGYSVDGIYRKHGRILDKVSGAM